MHRTPSTPALTGDYFPDAPGGGGGVGSPASRESLAELWQNFLEQESGAGAGAGAGAAKEGGVSGKGKGKKSRAGSLAEIHSK